MRRVSMERPGRAGLLVPYIRVAGSPEQLACLRGTACELVQGSLLDVPRGEREVRGALRAGVWRARWSVAGPPDPPRGRP